eukprot:6776-Heterococcus_DN1.PRE.2
MNSVSFIRLQCEAMHYLEHSIVKLTSPMLSHASSCNTRLPGTVCKYRLQCLKVDSRPLLPSDHRPSTFSTVMHWLSQSARTAMFRAFSAVATCSQSSNKGTVDGGEAEKPLLQAHCAAYNG